MILSPGAQHLPELDVAPDVIVRAAVIITTRNKPFEGAHVGISMSHLQTVHFF